MAIRMHELQARDVQELLIQLVCKNCAISMNDLKDGRSSAALAFAKFLVASRENRRETAVDTCTSQQRVRAAALRQWLWTTRREKTKTHGVRHGLQGLQLPVVQNCARLRVKNYTFSSLRPSSECARNVCPPWLRGRGGMQWHATWDRHYPIPPLSHTGMYAEASLRAQLAV